MLRLILGIFCGLGLFLSLYLTLLHTQGLGCGFSGCSAVLASSYATFFGVSLASIGFGYYGLYLGLVLLKQWGRLFFFSVLGLLASIGLILLQATVIQSWCGYCLGSAAIMLAIFGGAFWQFRKMGESLRQSISGSALGLLLLVFLLGSVLDTVLSRVFLTESVGVSIDGKAYTLAEIDREIGVPLTQLSIQQNDLRRSWVIKHLIDKDLAERGMTQEDLYKQMVRKNPRKIMETIRAYEAELLERYSVAFSLPIHTLSVDANPYGSLRIGPDEAKHVLEVFSDLECGHCRQMHEQLKAFHQTRDEDLAIVFRHFPIPTHRHAKTAARMAWCLTESGRAPAFIDAVFKAQNSLDEATLFRIAGSLDVARADMAACLSNKESLLAVEADVEIGMALGIVKTPTVFLDGVLVRSLDEVESVLDGRI